MVQLWLPSDHLCAWLPVHAHCILSILYIYDVVIYHFRFESRSWVENKDKEALFIVAFETDNISSVEILLRQQIMNTQVLSCIFLALPFCCERQQRSYHNHFYHLGMALPGRKPTTYLSPSRRSGHWTFEAGFPYWSLLMFLVYLFVYVQVSVSHPQAPGSFLSSAEFVLLGVSLT